MDTTQNNKMPALFFIHEQYYRRAQPPQGANINRKRGATKAKGRGGVRQIRQRIVSIQTNDLENVPLRNICPMVMRQQRRQSRRAT